MKALSRRRGMAALAVMALLLMAVLPLAAQEMAPSVTVADQPIVDGSVTVAKVVAAQDGWMVIHAQKDGGIGPVIGHAPVSSGENTNVTVAIDTDAATDTLYAMLHVDEGEKGVYEFPGPDGPVVVDGKPLAPAFMVTGQMTLQELLVQRVESLEAQVTDLSAALSQAQVYQVANTAFLVRSGELTDPAGVAQLRRVILATAWPDEELEAQAQELASALDGLAEALENEEETADLLEAVEEARAELVEESNEWLDQALGILEPKVEVEDQAIMDGTVTIQEVVAAQDGWIAIHAQKDGGIGPVIGHAPVSAGETYGVVVEIDTDAATDTLYAMLHVDEGEKGVYEFPGPDGPVVVDGKPLAPAFTVEREEAMEEETGMEEAVITVPIASFSFGEDLVIPVGATVEWINQDRAPHTVTSSDGSLFESGTLRQGDTFRFTFTEPGEYPYYCRFHGAADGQGMAGKIIVTEQ